MVQQSNNLKLSAPWVIYWRELKALFDNDPEVTVEFDEDNIEIKLLVNNERKAEALGKLLPDVKDFGNVQAKITVIPENKEDTLLSLYKKAFDGNPAFSYVFENTQPFQPNMSFVVFKREVVQYFNDDLSDVHGVCSTLYQDIARDVFGEECGVCFCTDVPEGLGKPLGEWP